MSRATAKANAKKSKIRAHVEHVFADQKDRMGLFIRTIGINIGINSKISVNFNLECFFESVNGDTNIEFC